MPSGKCTAVSGVHIAWHVVDSQRDAVVAKEYFNCVWLPDLGLHCSISSDIWEVVYCSFQQYLDHYYIHCYILWPLVTTTMESTDAHSCVQAKPQLVQNRRINRGLDKVCLPVFLFTLNY